jgi:D-alanyl-D-alanine carboxypeptidase/D-alanyl-D-alanine-endopeptidase (penicillin-binding protein 4)
VRERDRESIAAAAALWVVAAVAFAAAACAPASGLGSAVPRTGAALAVIDSVVRSPPLDRTQWGLAVVDRRTGASLVARDAERHFIPASNTKLVVAVVALGELGPDWRYETPVRAAAASGDTSAASLLVLARGDPTWSRRFLPHDLAAVDSIADEVSAAGIRQIGELAIDATYFTDSPVHSAWEVGDLPWAYAPPIDALAIAEATFRFVVTPGVSLAAPATVTPIDGSWQPLVARFLTDTARARSSNEISFLSRLDTVYASGRIAVGGGPDTFRLAVTSPAQYAARALRAALENRGVRVLGKTRVIRDSTEAAQLAARVAPEYREVARLRSPPLIEIIAAIFRPSQNWIAEQLLKTIGAERAGAGSWSAGLEVERRYLVERVGLDSTAFFLRDASGLAAQNLLTPAAVVRLLEHGRSQPWGEAFRDALPEPGMKESTLENRLEELSGRLRAKTGSITNVNTLSGFLLTRDGRELVFSIMTNASGTSATAVRRGMDRIVRALAGGGAAQ